MPLGYVDTCLISTPASEYVPTGWNSNRNPMKVSSESQYRQGAPSGERSPVAWLMCSSLLVVGVH